MPFLQKQSHYFSNDPRTYYLFRTISPAPSLNPWIPKVRIQGDSTKVGSKMTLQEKSIFPRKINKARQIFQI